MNDKDKNNANNDVNTNARNSVDNDVDNFVQSNVDCGVKNDMNDNNDNKTGDKNSVDNGVDNFAKSNANCGAKNDMNDNKNNKVGDKDNADNKKVEKLPTKGSIYCTDIFFIAPFLLIAIAGFVCITFVGACVAISACIWLFKSFSLATSAQQWGGFALSILMLATAAIMFWSDYFIVKSTTKGVKRHVKERKEILCQIEKTQNNA